MRTFTAAAFAAGVLVASGVSDAAVIGLDSRFGNGDTNLFSGTYYDQMRQAIIAKGHTIVEVNSYDAGSLAGLDALLTREAFNFAIQFSSADADAIEAFNAAGGGVAFFADGGFDSNGLVASNNKVANVLGATLSGVAFANTGFVVDQFNAHPMINGVDAVGFDFARRVLADAGSSDLTVNGATEDVIVAREGLAGIGNTAVIGDATWMLDGDVGADFDFDSADNDVFFGNTIDWILGIPSPGPTAVFGVAALAAVRRRR